MLRKGSISLDYKSRYEVGGDGTTAIEGPQPEPPSPVLSLALPYYEGLS